MNDTLGAAELRARLLPLVAAGEVRVEAGAVESIATACAQVLLAADKSLARQGGGLCVIAASPVMRAAFAELGLGAELARWTGAHG